jgi:ParB-like chromosome segregation protein Spo0J
MNRAIDSKHVQKMITSIRKMGVLRSVITCTTNMIEGSTKTYVIDGQHLATALEREGEPIPYIEIEIESEEDAKVLGVVINGNDKDPSRPDGYGYGYKYGSYYSYTDYHHYTDEEGRQSPSPASRVLPMLGMRGRKGPGLPS